MAIPLIGWQRACPDGWLSISITLHDLQYRTVLRSAGKPDVVVVFRSRTEAQVWANSALEQYCRRTCGGPCTAWSRIDEVAGLSFRDSSGGSLPRSPAS